MSTRCLSQIVEPFPVRDRPRERPVREAKFKFVNLGITDVQKSQEGREVQFANTDKALREAILGATGA